jgi:hypothetical protein
MTPVTMQTDRARVDLPSLKSGAQCCGLSLSTLTDRSIDTIAKARPRTELQA